MELNQIKLNKDTRQRERQQVVDKIVEFLKENADQDKIQVFKNWGSGLGKSGRPDIEIVYNKQTWYVEAKDPKGKLSSVQTLRKERFERAGVPVYVIDSKERFITEVWTAMNK
jgi:hypothetical protein